MSMALGAPAAPPAAPPGAADALTLTVGGVALGGWQSVRVTRALAMIPASFDIQVTERYPNTAQLDIKPGQPCTVQIGGDLVLTGYVDRYTASISGQDHTVRIEGRSKSEDLMDCAAFVALAGGSGAGMQIMNGSALAICQKLAAPYNVTIQSIAGDGAAIPQFNVNLGETVWEIMDRLTRYSQLVAYDMPDGSVMLAQAGSEKMASGIALGVNIESAGVMFSMDGRFSEYEGHFLSSMVFGSDTGVNTPGVGKIVTDDGVPRFRKRYVISEQTVMGVSLAYDRAVWERNRNYGRSMALRAQIDAWRDSAGALWAPNHLAPIVAPILKLPSASWVIASVTYLRDTAGQHAALVLMPVEAFAPEPVALQPLPPLVQDIQNNNPTTVPPT
jgi:prophage tail gpP-like protein